MVKKETKKPEEKKEKKAVIEEKLEFEEKESKGEKEQIQKMEDTYSEFYDRKRKEFPCGICPSPVTDSEAWHYIKKYLLRKDFSISLPVTREQANAEIIHDLLMNYSKEYRKEYKKWCQEYDKKEEEERNRRWSENPLWPEEM